VKSKGQENYVSYLRAAAPAADPGKELPFLKYERCQGSFEKKKLPAGKHHGSEGRASAKTTLKNSLTCHLKSPRQTTFFETAGSRTASKINRKKAVAGRQ